MHGTVDDLDPTFSLILCHRGWGISHLLGGASEHGPKEEIFLHLPPFPFLTPCLLYGESWQQSNQNQIRPKLPLKLFYFSFARTVRQ
jgi:hypothetical protein